MRHLRVSLATILAIVLVGSLFFANSCAKKEPETIKIGAILPLSGDAAQYGEWGKSGISLAADEINSKGGIKGKRVEVIYEDDAADPKKGVAAVNKLINIDKVKLIVGPIPSTVTLAVAPICEKSKVVIMSSSSSPAITRTGDYIFRNWPSDDFEGVAMAKYAIKKNFKKVAILHINNEYGLGVANVFKKEYSKLGGVVLITETYMQGSSDMRPQLTKIKKYNPDVIYLVGHAKENGHVIKQANDLNIKAQILGTVGVEGPDLINIAGKSAEGLVYTAPAFDPDSPDPTIKTYQEAYIKKYGKKSEIFAATTYDATKIITFMIEKYGYDPDKIKDGLYKLKNYQGVSGITTFDENGDVIKPVMLKTVKDKQFVPIKE
jgi:branched-chain amino acid transport system substrate-binding protein